MRANLHLWLPQLIVTLTAFLGVGMLLWAGKVTGEGAIGLAAIFAIGLQAWVPSAGGQGGPRA